MTQNNKVGTHAIVRVNVRIVCFFLVLRLRLVLWLVIVYLSHQRGQLQAHILYFCRRSRVYEWLAVRLAHLGEDKKTGF